MKALKFLIIWGIGVLLLQFAIFARLGSIVEEPKHLLAFAGVVLVIWTIVSGVASSDGF